MATYNDGAKITVDEGAVRLDLLTTTKQMFVAHVQGEQTATDMPASLAILLSMSTSTVPTNTSASDGLFINVLDRDAFRKSYAPAASAANPLPAFNVSVASGIHWNSGIPANAPVGKMLTYTALTPSSTTNISNETDEQTITSDVNCHELLIRAGFTELAAQLRELKIAYQLLDDDTYHNLTNTTDENGDMGILPNIGYFRVYDMALTTTGTKRAKVLNEPSDYTPTEISSDKTNFTTSSSIINFIRTLDPKTQDIFVLRRMILATYLVAHYHFFMSIFVAKKNNTADASSPDAAFAAKIAFYFYNKLQYLNISYEQSRINSKGNSTANDSVTSAMLTNIKEYTSNTNRLAFLHTDISEKKRFLTNEIARVASEKANSEYAKKLKIVTLVFSIIFAVSIIVVFALPFDFGMRMKVAGGMAALILVLAIIMFAVVRRVDPVHEGFLNTPAIAAIAAVTSASINEYEKLVTLLIMEEVRNFYKNTIDISMILKNIRLYSELNYNSGKERNYFENNQYMLNKSVTDARNAQRLFDRKTKLSTALIKVTLQLIVIIAFVMLGIMAVQDVFPGMRPVIYTIGGLMAVISIILFCADVLGRTHTDSDKKYWGSPEAAKRL